jgi:8-oxo-dGTP pyrophosphatase MutT (NUDIX family)
VLRREAAHCIVLRDRAILLLYTERYNGFSFCGWRDPPRRRPARAALRRELEEETGATNVCAVGHYGYVEEFRPHWKPGFNLMHMTSQFFSSARSA